MQRGWAPFIQTGYRVIWLHPEARLDADTERESAASKSSGALEAAIADAVAGRAQKGGVRQRRSPSNDGHS